MARSDEIWRVDAGALHGSRSRTPEAQRNYVQSYTYDPVGNILRMKHVSGGVTVWHRGYDYAEDGNRLEKTSLPGDDVEDPGDYSESYTHDAHGSMTAMPSIPGGLTWDPQDRLIETDLSGGGVVYYVYDSAGMRVRKVWVNQSGTTSKERYYLGAWETYRETTDLLGTPTLDLERETLHVDDAAGAACLIETKTVESATPIGSPDSVLRYQHHNHLGTATLELTGDAEVISYEEYHPYGTSAYRAANSAVDVSPKRYRYTGKERDEETGLYYHEARYYACWLGRWSAADPIALKGGINRYRYANNCPPRLRDSSGEAPEEHPSSRGVRSFTGDTDPKYLSKGFLVFDGAHQLTGEIIEKAARLLIGYREADEALFQEKLSNARHHKANIVTQLKSRELSREQRRTLGRELRKSEKSIKQIERDERSFRGRKVEWALEIWDTERGIVVTTPLPGTEASREKQSSYLPWFHEDLRQVLGVRGLSKNLGDIHTHPNDWSSVKDSEKASSGDVRGTQRSNGSSDIRTFIVTPEDRLVEFSAPSRETHPVNGASALPLMEAADPKILEFVEVHRTTLSKFQRANK